MRFLQLLPLIFLAGCINYSQLKENSTISESSKQSKFKADLIVPKMRYIGNLIQIKIILSNPSNKPVKSLNVSFPIPNNTKINEIENGGQQSDGKIFWQILELKPNSSLVLCSNLQPFRIMKIKTTVTITEDGKFVDELERTTDVQGIPAFAFCFDSECGLGKLAPPFVSPFFEAFSFEACLVSFYSSDG